MERTPRDNTKGHLSVNKITCLFCQKDHFASRCNTAIHVNTKTRKCYIGNLDVLFVQRKEINQEIIKARTHLFAENDDITQASVKTTKMVRDNRRVMVKLTIQRRRRMPKATKNTTNSQTH